MGAWECGGDLGHALATAWALGAPSLTLSSRVMKKSWSRRSSSKQVAKNVHPVWPHVSQVWGQDVLMNGPISGSEQTSRFW